jgi:mannose-6-phosphate isomerase-like protein (cupin superfamily)
VSHPPAGPVPVVNLVGKFATFHDHWHPRIVAELNGQQVKLAKFQGAFDWHFHADEDELFLVHRGRFQMEFRDRTVTLEQGELLVVPRGVEHRPVAVDEVEVILFEPAGTRNTGNQVTERTVTDPKRI